MSLYLGLIAVGRKGRKPCRNGKHWVICTTRNYYINRSMPRISDEWKGVGRRFMGESIGRLGDDGEGH